jgi:hypothetical protein
MKNSARDMLFRNEKKLSLRLTYKSSACAIEIPATATFGELRVSSY